jgi:hypothetical protein
MKRMYDSMSPMSSIESILFVSKKNLNKIWSEEIKRLGEKRLQMNPADRIHDKSLSIQNSDLGGER